MARSIIFFDIDGTLLDDDKRLPPSAKEAVMALKAAGHEVAIATGRAPFMFESLRQELGIDTYVSYNGQYVVLRGEEIYTNPLDRGALIALAEQALSRNHPIVYMDHQDMKANVPYHEHIVESIGSLKIDFLPAHDPDYYVGRKLYQALLFCSSEEEGFYEETFPPFDFVRWHPLSTDILPAGGSKAKGIRHIIERLAIPPERQYAFGDGLNDLEMLSEIHHGVAMGNGHELAKQAARHLTKAVDEDGIAHGLKMLGLL